MAGCVYCFGEASEEIYDFCNGANWIASCKGEFLFFAALVGGFGFAVLVVGKFWLLLWGLGGLDC